MKRNPKTKTKTKTLTKHARITRNAMQIARLAPVVAAARMTRAASRPGADSMNELSQMGREKASVFTAATVGMFFAGASAMTRSAFAIANLWSPWGGTVRQRMARMESTVSDAPADIVLGALAPIRKRVVANSKRLGR